MLERVVPYREVETVTGARVKSYENDVLTAETAQGEVQIPCDSVYVRNLGCL